MQILTETNVWYYEINAVEKNINMSLTNLWLIICILTVHLDFYVNNPDVNLHSELYIYYAWKFFS